MGNESSRISDPSLTKSLSVKKEKSAPNIAYKSSMRVVKNEDTGNENIHLPSVKNIVKWNASKYADLDFDEDTNMLYGIRKADDLQVAIKKISKDGRASENIGSFPKEYVIMNSLHHPNIATIYGIEEDERNFYIVIEFYSEGDLDTYMNNFEYLPHETVFHIAKQIVSALKYCHERNVVHRDIKLENIFVRGDPEREEDEVDLYPSVVLADFGFASIRPIEELLYDHPGTADYAAPELFQGVPYRGDKADVWALGIVLYALFTGELPFHDKNRKKLVENVKTLEVFPELPRNEMEEMVPGDCRALIKWMLTKDANERPSIQEVERHPCLK